MLKKVVGLSPQRSTPLMGSSLTSWKEIANYLHKGIRTVQRWEADGLPVRRPNARNHGLVMAVPNELDAWVRSKQQCGAAQHSSPLTNLTLICHESIDENRNLRFQRNQTLADIRKQRLKLMSQLREITASCSKV